MKAVLFFFLLSGSISIFSQDKVSFYSSDSLKITADLYLIDYQSPFILLFHQSESSRGEFSEIAPRLQKLGYNCLAVDLRSGGKMNYVENETARRAHEAYLSCRNIDAMKDMQAALTFIRKFNRKPVILFGSSYSASLSLLMAKTRRDVIAVVAFSPGEYFRPELSVKDSISGLSVPVFVASTDLEAEYVEEMLTGVDDKYKTLFKPENGRGVHGAGALREDSEESETCWFKLTRFIGNLGKI